MNKGKEEGGEGQDMGGGKGRQTGASRGRGERGSMGTHICVETGNAQAPLSLVYSLFLNLKYYYLCLPTGAQSQRGWARSLHQAELHV